MKTLGIKFEVAGVKEAQAGLNSYKNSLNQSLQQNKQAADKSRKEAFTNQLSFRNSIKGRRQLEYEASRREASAKALVSHSWRYRYAYPLGYSKRDPQKPTEAINKTAIPSTSTVLENQKITEAVAQGTKQGITDLVSQGEQVLVETKRTYRASELCSDVSSSASFKNFKNSPKYQQINTGFYGGIGQEAGRQAFVNLQNLVGKFLGLGEQRETINISDKSIARLAATIGATVKANKFLPSNIQISIPKLVESKQTKQAQGGGLISSLLSPISTVKFGFFEGIGASFGHQYAKGFADVLMDKLDIDFERKGKVGGVTAFHVKETGIPEFIKNIKDTSNLFEKLDLNLITTEKDLTDFYRLIKQISKAATTLPSSYLTGYRKGNVEIEGLRKLAQVADQIKDEDLPDLTGKKRLLSVIGGFAAEEGRSGHRMAEELKNSASDDTAVMGVDNKETDLTFSVFGNKALWGANLVQKIVDLNLKGYNTDSVKMAAEVLAILKKYPNLEEIRLSGHSAGGFNVEEVQEMLDLLKQAGHLKTNTKITTIATGTPQTIGGLNNPNTVQLLGDKDEIIKSVEGAGEFLGVTKPRSEKDLKGVASHYGGDYLVSNDYLKALLGDGFDPKKNKQLKKSRSPFKGQLIEIEQLYVNYLAAFTRDIDDLYDELSIAPDRLVAKARSAKISGKPKEQAVTKLQTRDFERFNLKDATKTAVVVVNGFGGEGGKSGQTMANGLAKMTNDPKIQFFGGANPHTDTLTKEQLAGEDINKVAEIATKHVAKLFYEAHALGVNQDAIEIAAQTLDMQQQNPDLDIKLLGNSFGGYIVEDVIALLKVMGADMKRIKAIATGTPELPGGIKSHQFEKYLGENDGVFNVGQIKAINKRAKELIGFDLLPDLSKKNQNLPNVNIHDLGEYIEKSPEIKDFIFGLQNSIDELLEIEAKIQDKSERAEAIPQFVENLRNNPNLSEEDKISNLLILRDQYIKTLQDIVVLSDKAKKLGGGRRFTKRGKEAAKELERINPSTPQPDTNRVVEEIEDPWVDTSKAETEVIAERAKRLAQQYKQYLRSISQKTTSDRALISQVVARDFAASDPGKQKELLVFIKQNFSAKAKAYRAAVKAGQLELAKEQGEDLIRLAASVKSLYGELAQFDQLDPEVQSNFKSYKGYISSVENEVLAGTGGKGRVSQGLPDLFADQVNLSNEGGENVAEGFINGILESLEAARSAGEQLIEAVDEGIRDAGEIQSPSKLAKRLGRWFAQGFGLGMSGENLEARGREVVESAAEGVREQVGNSFSADNIASLLDTSGAGIIKKLGSVLFDVSNNEGIDQAINMFGELGGKLIRLLVTFKLLKVAVDAMGLGKLVAGFQNLPEEAIKSALAVETLDNRIVKMSGSASQGAKNLAFITAEAKRLNLNLTNAKENYSQVLKATRDSALEGFQTENIYTAFAATAKANGLDQTQEQELFRSVRSMIGKGVLSQEEVRQEIGEKLGDFEQALAEAYGVSKPQLNKMIESGSIRATEALPKVAAILKAKNDIYGDLNTGAVAAQKADNAIVSFRESVGSALLPLQKFGNNFLAGFFNQISAGINTVKPLINGFFLALLANLLRVEIFGQTVQKVLLGLIKLLWTFKGAIAIFAVEMALIAAAWAAWENVGKMLKERFFPEINKDIEQITRGMKAYREAIEEANGAQEDLGNNKLQLASGFKLPENKFGDFIGKAIGSDYLNLDSLVREPLYKALSPLDKALGNKYGNWGVKAGLDNFVPGGRLISPFIGNGLQTARENREDQLKIDNSNLSMKGNQLLMESQEAFKAASEITKYDAQIAAIQSARLKLLPGDQDALKASLEEEKKINKERDKQLKIVTAYQQTLTSSAAVYKSRLEDLEKRYLDGEIGEGTYNSERSNLQGLLDDTEGKLKAVNNELSRVSTKLSEFQRRLQKGDQRVEGYFAQYDRQLQYQKAGIIDTGIADGSGTQIIQLELEEATKQDLSRRIDLVKKELAVLEKDLRSPELDAATKRIKKNLTKDNIPLNESSLNDIIEKSTVQADIEAAQGLLRQLKKDTQLAGLSEQMAQTLQSNRNALIELNRSIQDYLFRITQQIKEATLETQRLISDIFYTDIKSKLRAALAPGSNTFVNGIIDNVQSIIDQAGQVAQKIFGDSAAQLGFESETRTLATEMRDFLKEVKGASEALDEFANKLKGAGTSSSSSNFSSATTDNLTALRRAIIGKESGTNFKAVNPDSGALGYGQVMPANVASWTKQALGKTLTPEQFLNDSLAQVEVINFKLSEYLQLELKQGYDLDTAVRRVASTWYSGQPGNYNKTKARFYNGREYPSDDSFTKDILGRFKAEKGADTLVGFSSDVKSSSLSLEGSTVAQKALTWQGKHFKQGVYAMCAGFVRQVLKESGVNLGVTIDPYDAGKQPNNGELMARSFFGSDIGTVFKDKKQAQAGDLVGFFDTYQYGQKPGAITHVGIYTGDNQMVDRSTSSAPVRHRSIDSYGEGNYIFMRPHAYIPEGDISNVAQAKNEELVAAKAKNLELTKEQTQQLRESLETEVKNKIELNKRQGKQGRQESNAAVLGVEDKIFSFKNQYGYQSATAELTNNLRSLKQQFLDADLDIALQITNTEDAILSITNSIPVFTEQIAKFKAIGTLEALAAASIQQSALDELNKTLPTMQANLLKLQSLSAKMPGLQQQSEYFLRDQGIFKTELEALTKANTILSQKATLTEARGTLFEKRQVRLEQEDLRLELEIKEIQLNTPEGIERNTKILNAQRQSKVNKENVDYDAQLEELDIERKLLDYQTGIGDKKAGFMSRFGALFGAEKLKKENAIAQEKLRFERELIELEKQYKGEPEKLNRLTQAARELNSVNLLSIEREFKSLGNTVEDYFGSAAQGFFTQFTTNFFDGKASSDRALLEERLRYAEEVVGLENSNRDTPGKLAHLKNRARELNEEKLDKIRGEFNLFSRTIDLAKGALLEFVKQLAQLAAQQAASKFISSILGSILGGVGGKAAKVGNDYGSGAGTFTASEGITVGEIENYRTGGEIKKRKVSDRYTDLLKQNIPGVKSAWSSEGSDAQLGVFHTGEELLSRKTGEAGRYQALKYKLGINPLAKIANYESGGTIPEVGSSILSGIASSRPRIDYSFLSSGVGAPVAAASKTINIKTTVVTPNADSFKLNQDQMNQDLIERLRRGI